MTNLNSEIKKEVKEIAKTYRGILRYGKRDPFILIFLKSYFNVEYDEGKDLLTNYGYDQEIDAVYINKKDTTVYFIQSKYHNTFGDREDKELVKSFSKVYHYFSSKNKYSKVYNAANQRLKEHLAAAKEVIFGRKPQYKKCLIFITNGRFDKEGIKKIRTETNLSEDKLLIFDLTDIQLYFSQNLEGRIPAVHFNLPLPTKQNFKKVPFGQVFAYVFTTKVAALAMIYDKWKEDLFHSNIRNAYPQHQKINKAIADTLEYHPAHFWLDNNGVVIVCDDFKKRKLKISIRNASVVNGCQTIVTSNKVLKRISSKRVSAAEVIVKLIKLPKDESAKSLRTEIIQAANTQIPINS